MRKSSITIFRKKHATEKKLCQNPLHMYVYAYRCITMHRKISEKTHITLLSLGLGLKMDKFLILNFFLPSPD